MEAEINGKKVGFLHGYSAFKDLMLGWYVAPHKYQDDSGNFTMYAVAQILFTSYENWCSDLRKPAELKFDDFYEWSDQTYKSEDGVRIISSIVDEWGKSKHVKSLVEETQKKSQQKNPESTLTKSNQSVSES